MIPHSKPLMHRDDIRAVTEILESGMLAGGERVRSFEQALAGYIGLPHAAATSSGTAGLFLALRALDIGPGDEVAIPAYVCSSLLYAVRMTGAEPALADTGEDGIHPDADTIKQAFSPRTKAVLFAHLFGHACDLRDIVALGAPVIEDCAMAPGAEWRGRKAGALGSVAAVFSFYATKVIAAGEGGMVLSDDPRLTERVRDRADYADKIDDVGRFNLKMTDLAAALGNSQLGRLESMIARRRELAARYTEVFSGMGLELPFEQPGERCIFYRYVVGSGRAEQLRTSLHSQGVRAERPVFAPLSRYPDCKAECPGAERAWARSLSIPLYPALTDEEAETVIRAMRESNPLSK
ncbi:MAG: DegT/DnrJ/EryC1/StrS family aminotransferase [Candidatus Latescibacterota bacterium]